MLADRAAWPNPWWAGSRFGRVPRNPRYPRRAPGPQVLLCVLALFVLLPACRAGALRVTTWNLEPPASAGTNEIHVEEAAAALRQLDPDVILLQQVRDWNACAQLAEALKPAQYTVQVCSSFREAETSPLSGNQVAILSRTNAYLAWSEAWEPQGGAVTMGGFAFAALRIGHQQFGFFSVQAGALAADGRDPEQPDAARKAGRASVAQLLEQAASASNWATNRVEAFVVGATFDTRSARWAAARDNALRLFEAAEFGDAFRQTRGDEHDGRNRRAARRDGGLHPHPACRLR
jgi:hypothetical protein